MFTIFATAIVTIILSIITGLAFDAKIGAISLLCIPLIVFTLFRLESVIGFGGILLVATPFLFFAVKDCLED